MENTATAGVERQDQFTYALAHMSEFQNLIRFADTKAGAAVTLVSGLLASSWQRLARCFPRWHCRQPRGDSGSPSSGFCCRLASLSL